MASWRTTTYAYDALYQMTSASGPGYAETYSYDEVGNRLSRNGVTYTYNAGDQLVAASDGSSFTYDNDGNLRTRTQGGGTTTYSWDGNNRLIRVDLPDGSYVTYTYDSMDNRISRRGADGNMTYYVYDGLDLVQEVNAAGVVLANYVYDGLDHPLSMSRGGVTYYYTYDGQGNVTALVNAAGAVVASYRYDPWGNTLSVGGSQPTLANPFRFSGREWDAESGLYFLRARYYDPQLGRFISPDPASIIRDYVYAANNPINNSDPTGLSSWRVGGPLRPGYDAKTISEILDFVKKMSPKSTERYMIRHYLFALKDPEAVRIFRAFYQFAPTGRDQCGLRRIRVPRRSCMEPGRGDGQDDARTASPPPHAAELCVVRQTTTRFDRPLRRHDGPHRRPDRGESGVPGRRKADTRRGYGPVGDRCRARRVWPLQMVALTVSLRLRAPLLLALAAAVLAAASLAACAGQGPVRGAVTADGRPVAGATVRLRGSLTSTTTDATGSFVLPVASVGLHQAVIAWKEGYYPAGADLSVKQGSGRSFDSGLRPSAQDDKGGDVTLALKPHPTADDPTYQWLTSNPDPNVALGCGHCMAAYDEWRLDSHALSATNARFLSIYNGTDLAGQPSAGPGFRLDSPQDPGNCAVCHAPAAALAHGGSADMNGLSGVETEGVLCDLCHKIGDVMLDAATGLPHRALLGVQAYRLYRPAAGTQIFFGTLDDIPRRVSYSALEKESRFCAPCHSGGWWGVSAYASYDEWLASPYAAEGVTCQACHMPPSGGTSTLTSPCAPAAGGDLEGLVCRARACVECHRKPADDPARNPLPDFTLIPDRPASTIHTHRMTGVTDEAFMRSAVAMTVTATQGPDGVLVDVAITNIAAGHHIPTDSPLRNMILVVTARDAQGNPLPYLGVQFVPDWGGVDCGLPKADCGLSDRESAIGNYAGLPGKGFAKVLEDWDGTAPAPQWRNGIRIQSDNRIAARTTDVSQYAFGAANAVAEKDAPLTSQSWGEPAPPRNRGAGEGIREAGPITVSARLIFRRAFKPWMDAQGWNEPDLILAETTIEAVSSNETVLAALPQPRAAPLFPPSLAMTTSGERLRSTDFPTPQECTGCHPDTGQAWQASGHAAATTDPLYRAWFKAADQTTQGQISPFCAGCHTPIGLLSGQIRSRWAWSGRELYPLDDQAQTGVSCAVCHSLTQTGVGNASYVIAPSDILGTDHADTQSAIRNPQSAILRPLP